VRLVVSWFGRRFERGPMRTALVQRYVVLVTFLAVFLALTLAPPAHASATPVIAKAHYWLSFKNTSSGVAKTYINARIKVRDDSKSYLKIRIREQQPAYDWTHYRIYWRHAPRYYSLSARVYSLKWPAPSTFWGGGIYRVQIRVRDRDNNWSEASYHRWDIGD